MNIEEKLKLCEETLTAVLHYFNEDEDCEGHLYHEVFKALHHLQQPITYWRPMETAPRDGMGC